ncbi:unannotated protein [freshwater metagenome]|uniref:Unannotated protein n=1 Tax=freshwater metagenome TaxID=449393 RepID=A0A6J6H852_9ZZZZ
MRSGVAMTRSKSIIPPSTCASRSSAPTNSAPASRAACAASPAANTAMRTSVPVPDGRATVPRTIWSALRGSTPRRTESSTVSSNFADANVFTLVTASVEPCCVALSKLDAAALYFLPCCAISAPSGRAPQWVQTIHLPGEVVLGMAGSQVRTGTAISEFRCPWNGRYQRPEGERPRDRWR